MANTVRTQATVLEVPVTIQGSKTVEGTDQRELFTETTKTTLVFENGAVVKLNARLSVGQCVFLRNDQSDREILCKVLESKQAGQAGYTDLEFASYDPTFWTVPAVKPAPAVKKLTAQDRLEAAVKSPIAAPIMESSAPSNGKIPVLAEQPAGAGQKSEAQKKIDAAVKNLVGTPSVESSVPSSKEIPVHAEQPAAEVQKLEGQEEIEAAVNTPVAMPIVEFSAPVRGETPATFLETPVTTPQTATPLVASPLPEMLEAPHEALSAPHQPLPIDEELDWTDAKDAELVAALAAIDANSKGPREPVTKETQTTAETKAEAASENAPKEVETSPDTASEEKEPSPPASRIGRLREFTARTNPIAIGIAAAVVLAAVLGVVWNLKSGSSNSSNNQPAAVQSRQLATAQPSQAAASAVATGVTNAGAAPSQLAPNIQQPNAPQAPGRPVAQNPAAANGVAGGAPPSNGVQDLAAVAAAKLAASRGELTRADQEVLGLVTHRKAGANGDNAPARIVSQAAPAMPTWTQGTEMDHVVTLDALIDEKGNLVETKPLSGSHLLWPEAQRAVAIWVFAPAMKDGKPTSSRMVLTVQFQK